MIWIFKICLRRIAPSLLVLWPAMSFAQTSGEVEAKVKSAFLLNFARYVEWPTNSFMNSNSPVVIGVLTPDPLGRHLDSTVERKTVERRPVQIERSQNISGLTNCHVIFISMPERARLAGILRQIGDRSILTVSDMDHFTSAGGMIQLKKKQNTMRFDINREAAEKVHLKVSSKLLKLADNTQ
jgi:hypothetical protein